MITHCRPDKLDVAYLAVYERPTLYLNEEHERLCRYLPRKIAGKLHRSDILLLYELAYHATGPILEIGCAHGLSTSVLCRGAAASGQKKLVVTVDIDKPRVEHTRKVVAVHGGNTPCKVIPGDSAATIRKLKLNTDLVFIDGDHSYRGVRRDLQATLPLLAPLAFLAFHDYFDSRNYPGAKKQPPYGVQQAVQAHLPKNDYEFYGRYGAIGLFRARH